MVLTGTFEHGLDAKHRLAIPSEIREVLRPGMRGAKLFLYVTLGEPRTLCLYTERAFEQRAEELDHSELSAEEILRYERLMYSLARRVEVDPQGRVRLPEHLLRLAGLGPDVVILGVKDHLEVRDRADWTRQLEQSLAEAPHLLTNPRRWLKRPPAAPGSPGAPSPGGPSGNRGP